MDIEAAKKHLEAARQELSELCKGKRWQMTIPAQPDNDSDLLIGQALRDMLRLIGEIERLRTICQEAHELLWHYDLAQQPYGVDWGPADELRQKMIDRLALA